MSPYNFNSIVVANEKQKEYVENISKELIGTIPFHVNINTSFSQEGK